MIKFVGILTVIFGLFFSFPAWCFTVQSGSDALYFDMMGEGVPSQRKINKENVKDLKKGEAQSYGEPFNGGAYKDIASKLLDTTKDIKIPVVTLDNLQNKQELTLPSQSIIEFQLNEIDNNKCFLEAKDAIISLQEKSKNGSGLSFIYKTGASGKTLFYIDCLDSQTGKTDSKVILMTVR